jgi:predicted DNA-binding protein
MAMVRKQVYITQEQDERLKRLSQRLGITEAELIRRAIDGFGDDEGHPDWDVAVELFEKLTRRHVASDEPLPWSRSDIYRDRPRTLDPSAWLEELAFIEERERLLRQGGSTKRFRREDSYDES